MQVFAGDLGLIITVVGLCQHKSALDYGLNMPCKTRRRYPCCASLCDGCGQIRL